MPCFGGYTPFPLRMGQSEAIAKSITDALNRGRGTALDTTELASPVWVENHAIARAIADVWHTNERLSLQTDLARTTMLERWEAIFGIIPSPAQTDRERREVLAERQSRTGKATDLQRIEDILALLMPDITTSVVVLSNSAAGVRKSFAGAWLMTPDNPTAPQVLLSGNVTDTIVVEAYVATGGALGTATGWVAYTPISGPRTQTATATLASTPQSLGSTGLTFSWAVGTYTANTYYLGNAGPQGMWSSACDITILATKPTTMTEATYYERVSQIQSLLDAILPAWVSVHVARDGSVAGAFILDEAGNLDNHRLGA